MKLSGIVIDTGNIKIYYNFFAIKVVYNLTWNSDFINNYDINTKIEVYINVEGAWDYTNYSCRRINSKDLKFE